MRALSLLLPALLPATALAWEPVVVGGVPVSDFAGDASPTSLDLYGDASLGTLEYATSPDQLGLRLRTSSSPVSGSGLEPRTWAFLLDTDGDPLQWELLLAVTGSLGAVEVYENDGTDGTYPGDAHLTWLGNIGSYLGGNVSVADEPTGGAWLELYVLAADWRATTGRDLDVPLRIAAATGNSEHADWYDVAGCDGALGPCDDLDAVLSDVVWWDQDMDGLTDLEEADVGSDPTDADTDDDGRLDADELADDADGDTLPAWADCDSDADGIADGTEVGLTVAHADTDPAAGCWVPDLDPASTTSPSDADTDHGGIADGREDWSHDGRIDCTETDPSDPLDDLDSDADSVPDAVEGASDPDGDDLPAHLDLDADGDGIPDADEWADSDGDCVPDLLESDSDDDGIPDATEGTSDTDGDGTPDFQDPDSDGDGTPDADEGEGDSDCDGTPDYLDPDDTDGVCDTGDPAVDTGDFDPEDRDDEDVLWLGGDFTGGACSSVPIGAGALPMLLGLVAVGWRRRRRALATAAVVMAAPAAHAQDLDAERFAPAPGNLDLVTVHEATLPPAGPSGGLWFSYADDPLVVRYAPSEDRDEVRLLGSVATADLQGAWSLSRGLVGVALPVHLYTAGMVSGPTHLGDARVTGRVVLMERAGLTMGLATDLRLPTGSPASWVGAGKARLGLAVVDTVEAGPVRISANLGARTGTGDLLGDLRVSPALTWGAGAAAYRDRLGAAVEITGEAYLRAIGEPGATPAEILLTGRYRTGNLVASLGAGTGMTTGIGAPDSRVVAGLAWAPPRPEPVSVVDAPAPGPAPRDDPPPATTGDALVRVVGPSGLPVRGATVRILGTLQQTMRVGADGILEASLPARTYDVVVAADGWVPAERQLDIPAGARSELMVVLRPADVVIDAEAGQIYLTDKVFFALDKAELAVDSVQLLDTLVRTLQEHPEITHLRIEGHTDSQGDSEYNMDLSQARAAAVRTYLIGEGVEAGRLEAVGYGETRLLQEGDSDAVHATNRRVEFHIVE